MEPQSSPTGFCGNENLEIAYQSLKERHEGKAPILRSGLNALLNSSVD
jgi:hypothetical protein